MRSVNGGLFVFTVKTQTLAAPRIRSSPSIPNPEPLGNGAAGTEATHGALPGERGALSLLPGEVVVDDGPAGRSHGEPLPHVRRRQSQSLRLQGAHPNPP
jgi:hypothetical protein